MSRTTDKETYPSDDRVIGGIERWYLISIRLGLSNSDLRPFNEVTVILIVKGVDATSDGFFWHHSLSESISI